MRFPVDSAWSWDAIAWKFVFDCFTSEASCVSTPPSELATRLRLWIARFRFELRCESSLVKFSALRSSGAKCLKSAASVAAVAALGLFAVAPLPLNAWAPPASSSSR